MIQIAGLALLAVLVIFLLREIKPSFASPARIGALLLLFCAALSLYVPILERAEALLALSSKVDYATPLMRAAGVALICEITAMLCGDLGESSVATGVRSFGKLEILLLCLPLIDEVMEIAKELLDF